MKKRLPYALCACFSLPFLYAQNTVSEIIPDGEALTKTSLTKIYSHNEMIVWMFHTYAQRIRRTSTDRNLGPCTKQNPNTYTPQRWSVTHNKQ